jgi:hypothetical protein
VVANSLPVIWNPSILFDKEPLKTIKPVQFGIKKRRDEK